VRDARAWSLVVLCLWLGGCATVRIERERLPFSSPVIEVAPGAPYERCVRLESGERLYFSYKADPPMSFAIRREVRGAILSYLVVDASRDEDGVFPVGQTEDYCLHWEPAAVDVPWPTLLRFELTLNRAKR